jgi:hypothetical protein
MLAMFGPILNPTRGFWGFPAGTLPRLRFLRGGVAKSMIARDFSARGEPEKIFTLSFPARQGKWRRPYPAGFPLLWRCCDGAKTKICARSCKRCPRPLLWREHADQSASGVRSPGQGCRVTVYQRDCGQAQSGPENRIKDSQRSVQESLAMGLRGVYLPRGFGGDSINCQGLPRNRHER